ncbi:hypothetical protein BT69DRAFT_1269056 [Atractiella rhizophila]|nr:hypothetical protein BT69DRAFT_1269056 [Atractiella rhizophila]
MEDDTFASVAWDTRASDPSDEPFSANPIEEPLAPSSHEEQTSLANGNSNAGPSQHYESQPQKADELVTKLKREGSLIVEVKDPVKELEGTKEMFVSYLVSSQTSLPHFSSTSSSIRRRFQDFVFLREHLSRDFPAAVVPPLPDKHRLEYITGDRFSPEFIERRRIDLELFLIRLSRHPELSRAKLLQSFLESTEWNVVMHQHLAHPPNNESPERSTILDNLSDTLLNAFTKVRKPDERFVEMKDGLDKFQECLTGVERYSNRGKNRAVDLSSDYEDFAQGIQGLGYLESGITEPLTKFENGLLDFSTHLRETASSSQEPFNHSLSSLLAYATAFSSVLKLRDQKQLDFEELSAYLSSLASERDRLAGGHSAGLGITGYFKEKIETLRNGETELSRQMRIRKLDGKMKELEDAVTSAAETLEAFNTEVEKEHDVFQLAKRHEMKDLLGKYAEGQIEMYRKSIDDWDKIIPYISRIQVD